VEARIDVISPSDSRGRFLNAVRQYRSGLQPHAGRASFDGVASRRRTTLREEA
jgi:hypothetical protein